MRHLLTGLVRRVKRDPKWEIDPDLPLAVFISMMLGIMRKALRGMWRRRGFRKVAGITLMGKHVTLRNKRFISIGHNFIVEDYAEIQGLSRHGLRFGNRVSIGRFAMIRPSGYYGGVLGEGLIVGDNSNIGPYCYIGCSGGIRIGNNVMMGPRISMHAENHNFADPTVPMKNQGVTHDPIIIEDDCWIGSDCVILAGVTIGKGCIIAAGSVVNKDMPPYSIVVGVPGHVVRSRLEAVQSPIS